MILSKVSEVNYKVAKVTTSNEVRFLQFNMLKPYVEEVANPNEETNRARATPSRSGGFFEDPGAEDEDVELDSKERGNHGFRPLRLYGLPTVPPFHTEIDLPNERLPEAEVFLPEADVVETYDAADFETRKEDEHLALPVVQNEEPPEPAASQEQGGQPAEKSEGRTTRTRRCPPQRFGIDEFVWR